MAMSVKKPNLKRCLGLAAAAMLAVCFALRQQIADFSVGVLVKLRTRAVLTPEENALLEEWWRLYGHPVRSEAELQRSEFRIHVAGSRPALRQVVVENMSAQPIRNFWFHKAGAPNFYSTGALVRSVTEGKRTDTEKVVALFELFRRYYSHSAPMSTQSILCSPPMLFAVIGCAQCSEGAAVMETLCQMIGCDTRPIGLQLVENGRTVFAHLTMEARADGRWIYVDADGGLIYRTASGYASADELRRNPELIERLIGSAADTGRYDLRLIARTFRLGEVKIHKYSAEQRFRLAEQQRHPRPHARNVHTMRLDLLPRSRLVLNAGNVGKFSRHMRGEPRVYANGTLSHRFVLGRERETPQGVPLGPNGRCVIVPVVSPYLLIGGRMELRGRASPEDIEPRFTPFFRGRLVGSQRRWRDLSGNIEEQVVALDEAIGMVPITGYALKLRIPKRDVEIEVLTDLQLNPRALPELTPGENRFVFYAPSATRFRTEDSVGRSIVRSEDGLSITFVYEEN